MATVACLFSLEGMGGTDKLELSGFARAVGGKLDTNLATYEGYDSGVSFSEKCFGHFFKLLRKIFLSVYMFYT